MAADACSQLPSSVQNISVSYISQPTELHRVDVQLDAYLQPCLVSLNPDNSKAVCANGRVVAEQVLRVIARIDAAGKQNSFLSNAKLKSYKTATGLLDRMKALFADKTCH